VTLLALQVLGDAFSSLLQGAGAAVPSLLVSRWEENAWLTVIRMDSDVSKLENDGFIWVQT
jgi:hypothetical protein